ncbi:MAG TPA: PRC-barrel domain-containing protein [Candidatus Methanofastidiosa archaeon]|nr:PRC-barrel domain-containing protein [Candidatus Methanofastidiosa archaeon]HPR41354.1 PRC-barrel domain-containing protein [Candidatus Methanofastidiosa archaeon]
MKIKTLMGKKVYDSDAISIGKITDAEFNEDTYQIVAVEVSQGIMKKHKVEVEKIDKLGDSVILNVKLLDL